MVTAGSASAFDPQIINATGDVGTHVGSARNDGDGENDGFFQYYDLSIFDRGFNNPDTAQANVGQGRVNENNGTRVDEPEFDVTEWFSNVNWEKVNFDELLSAVNQATASESRAQSAKSGRPRGRHASGISCTEEQSMAREISLFFREGIFVIDGRVTTHFDPNGISPYEMAKLLYPLALQKRGHSDTVSLLDIRSSTKLNNYFTEIFEPAEGYDPHRRDKEDI